VIDVESDLVDFSGGLEEKLQSEFEGTAKQLFASLDNATDASDNNGVQRSDKTVNRDNTNKDSASHLTNSIQSHGLVLVTT
jgi:hypothetical protein